MVAKFVFKLQSLLNIKIQIENDIKNQLGKAIQKLEEEKFKILSLEKQRESCLIQFRETTTNKISVDKLKDYNVYISTLKDRIENQKESVKSHEKNVDIIREKLIKAVQERKALEKLKEKKYEEYLKEEYKQEQKINDEIISYKNSK